MEDNIEIKDNHSYDVLDKTPRWLMRWGVISVCLTISALLCISAIVPYYEAIRFPVTIGNKTPVYVISPLDGNVVRNNLMSRTTVTKGDTLLAISAPGESDSYITAPETGYVFYLDSNVFNITHTGKGDTLFRIVSGLDRKGTAVAFGFLDDKTPGLKLTGNKNPQIRLAANGSNAVTIKNNTVNISELPDAPQGRIVTIHLDSSALKELSADQKIYNGMPANVTITLRGKSVLRWIFD